MFELLKRLLLCFCPFEGSFTTSLSQLIQRASFNTSLSQLINVKLRKDLSTFQTVDEFGYPRKRVSILYINFVERLIVDANASSPIFLSNKYDWTSTRRGAGLDVTFVD